MTSDLSSHDFPKLTNLFIFNAPVYFKVPIKTLKRPSFGFQKSDLSLPPFPAATIPDAPASSKFKTPQEDDPNSDVPSVQNQTIDSVLTEGHLDSTSEVTMVTDSTQETRSMTTEGLGSNPPTITEEDRVNQTLEAPSAAKLLAEYFNETSGYFKKLFVWLRKSD